jgi:uncharacterized membrane protein
MKKKVAVVIMAAALLAGVGFTAFAQDSSGKQQGQTQQQPTTPLSGGWGGSGGCPGGCGGGYGGGGY